MEVIADNLTKKYGNKIAVDHVSLHLKPGVYGLLGPNGAGKTTLMRLLCGILRPEGGTVALDGVDVSKEAYRARLGYLPQEFGYYPEFSGWDFLMYMAALKGLKRSCAEKKAEELLAFTSLKDAAGKKIKTYSGGMKQRLGIAQVLLNEPDLLVLDEPTGGLDPKERVRFRELLAALGRDSIILMSTHIVTDVEKIADRILLMKEGRIIWEGAGQNGSLEDFYLKQFGEDYGNGSLDSNVSV